MARHIALDMSQQVNRKVWSVTDVNTTKRSVLKVSEMPFILTVFMIMLCSYLYVL